MGIGKDEIGFIAQKLEMLDAEKKKRIATFGHRCRRKVLQSEKTSRPLCI